MNNDGFNELRSILMNNFDYTSPDLTIGINNSNIAENGKISNVKVDGDYKYVNYD